MLYYLSQVIMDAAAGTPYEKVSRSLRLFHYISVRMAGAAVTARRSPRSSGRIPTNS